MNHYKFLRSVCVALWIGLLVAGLWPFNFFPKNKVEWLEDGNGIHFDWHGQIYTTASAELLESAVDSSANNSFSIEIWLRPDKAYSWGTVLSIYDPARLETFRINQSLTDLVLRGDFRGQNLQPGFKPVWMSEIFKNGQARFVTITSGPPGTTVYLEGAREHSTPYAPLAGNFSGRLIVGHSGSENSSWAGTLLALAIYDRALAADEVARHYKAWTEKRAGDLVNAKGIMALYPFGERTGSLVHDQGGSMPDLVIPERFYLLHRRFLSDPSRLQRSDISDATLNIIGFIPFGFLVALYLLQGAGLPRSKAIVWAILLGGMTSFLIEFLQAYLPTRDSSYLDLINNILGTAVGAIATGRFPRLARYFTGDTVL
jgi:VanZ family protein